MLNHIQKGRPTGSLLLDYERWARSGLQPLGSQPTSDLVINPTVGCHYFRQAHDYIPYQRTSLPLRQYKLYCLVTEAPHTGVNKLPKVVTQQCQSGVESATSRSQICKFNAITIVPSRMAVWQAHKCPEQRTITQFDDWYIGPEWVYI